MPGFGEGVSLERFEEGFDVDPRHLGAMVKPKLEELGPGVLATPDERERIAQKLRQRWIEGGFQALPEGLRGPTTWEVRAPEGGLNEEIFAGFIDDVRGFLNHVPTRIPRKDGTYREVPRNIPRLWENIPEQGDLKGTAAALEVHGKIYLGVNSGALNDRGTNKLAGQLVKEQFELETMVNQPWHHAESMALIRAYYDQPGALPRELTLYVDRDRCKGCRDILPGVIEAVGVDRLTIVMKSSTTIPPIYRRGLMQE